MPHKLNVLITSFGSSNARAISRIVHERFPDFNIFGCDINPPGTLTSFPYVKNIFQVPEGNHPQYIKQLLDMSMKFQIDLLIPIHDVEMIPLSLNVDLFTSNKIKLFLPSPQVVEYCRNKFLFYLKGKELGFPIIESSKEPFEKYPQFIKPVTGNGSIDCFKIWNIQEAKVFKNRIGDALYQEFIEGKLLNVDFVANESFDIVCAMVREEITTKSGIGVKVKIIEDQEAIKIASEVVKKLQYKGLGGFELFKTEDGYKIIELNPRPNSGIIYSHLAGLDILGYFFQCSGIPNISIEHKTIKYGQLMSKELVAFKI